MSSPSLFLKQLLQQQLALSPQGRLTFADYMNLVLYHPQHGYYSSELPRIGKKGDFYTSSSLGPEFGQLLAQYFQQMWVTLDYPQPFTLVEMGAGTGQLAADVLSYLAQTAPAFWAALEYVIIETSESLKIQQQTRLSSFLPKISWLELSALPDDFLVGCIFSNELIDAFPVHLLTIQNGKLQEIYVTLEQEEIKEIIGDISNSELSDYFSLIGLDFPNSNYEDGYRTEVNLKALLWLKTVASKLKKGYILTIDYGYDALRYYHPQRHQGTLQCYYRHRRHSDPYIYLGEQDLTAHVDFTALQRQGEKCGLVNLGLTRQALFLMSLGLGELLANLNGAQLSLPELLSRRDRLHQLIDPQGLGNFFVLLQGKNLSNVKETLKFP